jgi:phosphoribosylglycinamide formyltransferase-1
MPATTRYAFVSERIRPVVATIDSRAMATGGPGLPREFTWRGKPLVIAQVLKAWRETGPCTSGSAEAYVRKHWFEVETSDGRKARIYFDRQARDRDRTARWWLFSMEEPRHESGDSR